MISLYRQVIRFRHFLFDRGILRRATSKWPVISIGGIETGGSGKTPVTIETISYLKDKGLNPVLLSRGYGRDSMGAVVILPEDDVDPKVTGDEPALIVKRTGVPAVVSKDRWRDIELVDRLPGEQKIVVMDDGFQHRFLERDLDIVTISGDMALDKRRYLPFQTNGSFARSLRDIPERLKEADLILFKGVGLSSDRPSGIFSYSLDIDLPPEPIVVLTSIASPEGFLNLLKRAGVRIEYHLPFRDHHKFTSKDLSSIGEICLSLGVKKILTTEKDSMRLPVSIADIEIIPIPIKVNLPEIFWQIIDEFCSRLDR